MKTLEQLEERLRLMRSLEGHPREECLLLANETLSKYSPDAEQLGYEHIQSELQDLSVRYGYPDDYKQLKKLLLESEALCETTFKTFSLPICSLLDSVGFQYTFKYRMKSIYSIWRKMRLDHKYFDDVYDLFASRIIFKPGTARLDNLVDAGKIVGRELDASFLDQEKLDVWRIYTIITALYRPHPDRVRDWITYPKPSGYMALQATVMGPDCNWIEIQIRSERMDYEAELGRAAHWLYKQETSSY